MELATKCRAVKAGLFDTIADRRLKIFGLWAVGFVFVFFHLASLMRSGWLSDEVFHIRFLNQWFETHFFEYFFQKYHLSFPPRSPVFGNPPFSMFIMTFGLWVNRYLPFGVLFSTRLINLVIGIFSTWMGTKVFRQLFPERSSWFFLVLASTLPAYIVINTTAYLDGVFLLLLLSYVHVSLKFIIDDDYKFFVFSALLAGLAFITKYQFFMQFFPFLFLISFRLRSKTKDLRLILFYFLAVYVTAATFWVGFRDIDQLQKIFISLTGFAVGSTKSNTGLFSDFVQLQGTNVNSVFYYFYQLLGKMPLIHLFGFIVAVYAYLRGRLSKSERFSLNVLALSVVSPLLTFGLLGGVTNTIHRVAMVFPFWLMISAFGLEYVGRVILERKGDLLNHLFGFAVFCSSVSIFWFWAPEYFNFYTNPIDHAINLSDKRYRNGDGEGMKVIAEWFQREGLDKSTKIGVSRLRFVMKEYLPEANLVDFPLNQGCEYAMSRGVDYVVIHAAHFTGGITPVFATQEDCFKEVYVLNVNGKGLIRVYRVEPSLEVKMVDNITIGNKPWLKTKSRASRLAVSALASGGNKIEYDLKGGDWAFLSVQSTSTHLYDGVIFEVSSTSTSRGLYLDLVGPPEAGFYYRFKIDGLTPKPKTYFVPYGQFQLTAGDSKNASIDAVQSFKISVDSQADLKAAFYVHRVQFYKNK